MAKDKKETVKKTVRKEAPKTKKADEKVKKTVVAKPVKAVKEEKTAKIVKAKKEVAPVKEKPAKKTKVESKEDTGSVEFQISNFSDKIKSLAKHLKNHTHDFDSRRGLLIMVGKRRRLLNYLKKSDPVQYEEAVKSLKLKA